MSTPQPFDPYAYAASQGPAPAAPAAFDPYAYAASAPPPNPATASAQPQPGGWERSLGLAARTALTTLDAPITTIEDAGVAARNLIGDALNRNLGRPATPDYAMPSEEFQQELDRMGLPRPQTPLEKGVGTAESLFEGAALPAGAAHDVEAVIPEAQATLRGLRNGVTAMVDDGTGNPIHYVVPPATSNPTLVNTTLESVSGKVATQQAASRVNQAVTDQLAKRSLGLPLNVPLSRNAIQQVRADAAKDYAAIGNVPSVSLGKDFHDAIDAIVTKFNSTASEIPSLAKKDLQPIVDDLKGKDEFSGNALLGAIRSLRDKADMAFRAGDGGLGSAYKQLSGAVENGIDQDLSSRGPQYQGLLSAFRSARTRIAMSHTVEDAFNEGTGHVVAKSLGNAVRRGEPLSGDLRTIGEFAAAAPKAVAEPQSIGSPVSHLSTAIPVLTEALGAAAHHPLIGAAGVGAPLARLGARSYLLSDLGQSSALPAASRAAVPLNRLMFGLPGAAAVSQE